MAVHKKEPVVSVICWAYNQEHFIAQTLDGFIMQQTKFPFEVIIHDDASTDKTADIIREYERKYPDIFRPIYQKVNQFSSGTAKFINRTFEMAQGKYIALCEGDDYWTDPEKLQVQVDFMEQHTDYALCFHPVQVSVEDDHAKDYVYPDPKDKKKFNVQELLKENFIQTNSVLYRRQEFTGIPGKLMPRDWYLHLYFAQFGKIGFIDRVMSVYRIHEGGIWHNHQRPDFWKEYGLAYLEFFVEVQKLYRDNETYKASIETSQIDMFNRLLAVDLHEGTDLVRLATESFPEAAAFFIARQNASLQAADSELKDKAWLVGRLMTDVSNSMEGIHRVKASRSFKTGYFLLHPWKLPSKASTSLTHKLTTLQTKLHDRKNITHAVRQYAVTEQQLAYFQNSHHKKLAVVLHLYYPDLWDYFKDKLANIEPETFDLFISLPEGKGSFRENILCDYPDAYIVETPNRGRDVLPFLKIATVLPSKGYEYVLKLHSKKSMHRPDGGSWLQDIVDALIPESNKLLREIIESLDKKDTGVIGPAGQFIPLSVNYEANKSALRDAVTRQWTAKMADYVDTYRHEYGFFAGTMFWARLDAVQGVFDLRYGPEDFDPEAGQIDATFAHMIERLLCLVPELEKKRLYEVGYGKCYEIPYETHNIPAWADVYFGNIKRDRPDINDLEAEE